MYCVLKKNQKIIGGEFARFVVVGVGATLVHLAAYFILLGVAGAAVEHSLLPELCYAVGYGISFVFNYIVSLKWTFRVGHSVGKSIGFSISHLLNALLHLFLFHYLNLFGCGAALAAFVVGIVPDLVAVFPMLAQGESYTPFFVYALAIPMNFLMVRYVLKSF